MGIIVTYFGCFYVHFFMAIIMCIYVYIVMGDYLCVFICIYAHLCVYIVMGNYLCLFLIKRVKFRYIFFTIRLKREKRLIKYLSS